MSTLGVVEGVVWTLFVVALVGWAIAELMLRRAKRRVDESHRAVIEAQERLWAALEAEVRKP